MFTLIEANIFKLEHDTANDSNLMSAGNEDYSCNNSEVMTEMKDTTSDFKMESNDSNLMSAGNEDYSCNNSEVMTEMKDTTSDFKMESNRNKPTVTKSIATLEQDENLYNGIIH